MKIELAHMFTRVPKWILGRARASQTIVLMLLFCPRKYTISGDLLPLFCQSYPWPHIDLGLREHSSEWQNTSTRET